MTAALATQPTVEIYDERTALELVAVARLEALHVSHGGLAHYVGPYNGELDGAGPEEELAERVRELIGGNTPALLVSTGTGRYAIKNTQKRLYTQTLDLHVMVVSNNLVTKEARQHREAYPLLKQVRDEIAGSPMAEIDTFDSLVPARENPEIQIDWMTIWVATYHATFTVTAGSQKPKPVAVVAESVLTRMNLVGADEVNPVAEALSPSED